MENRHNVYNKDYFIDSRMVDMFRRITPSQLLLILQDAALNHALLLSCGDAATRSNGLAWVIARQNVQIVRMPKENETIHLKTWPGESRLFMMPRFSEISDGEGNVLVRSAAVWTLIDITTRKAIMAKDCGFTLPVVKTGTEISFLQKIQPVEEIEFFSFTVPFSYCDVNQHLNNTRYLDIAVDHAMDAPMGKEISSFVVEYQSEARFGEALQISHGASDGLHYYYGKVGERACFRIALQYGKEKGEQ